MFLGPGLEEISIIPAHSPLTSHSSTGGWEG